MLFFKYIYIDSIIILSIHQFNEDRTGKLTYTQFNKFIMNLCTISGEEPPSFSIIKDLFDFIDIRKDGIIDLNEWMQTFKMIEVNFLSSLL